MSATLHPQAIIEDGVTLEPGVTVMPGAMLRRGTHLGANVVVHPYAVIGGEPQDLRFSAATVSGVRVGEEARCVNS